MKVGYSIGEGGSLAPDPVMGSPPSLGHRDGDTSALPRLNRAEPLGQEGRTVGRAWWRRGEMEGMRE